MCTSYAVQLILHAKKHCRTFLFFLFYLKKLEEVRFFIFPEEPFLFHDTSKKESLQEAFQKPELLLLVLGQLIGQDYPPSLGHCQEHLLGTLKTSLGISVRLQVLWIKQSLGSKKLHQVLQEGERQRAGTAGHQDSKGGEDMYHAKALHPPPRAVVLTQGTVLEVLQLQTVNYSLQAKIFFSFFLLLYGTRVLTWLIKFRISVLKSLVNLLPFCMRNVIGL